MQNLPLGAASTGLTFSALKKVLTLKDETDTEVWGGYFIGSGHFKTKAISLDNELFHHPEIRLTLDYEEDYQFLTEIFAQFNTISFSSFELMDLLVNKRPDIVKINRMAQKKYEKHIASAAPVKFKILEEV